MKNFVFTLAAAALLAHPLPASAQAQPAPPAPPKPVVITSETTTRPSWEFGLGYQWLRTGTFCAAFDASDCTDDNPKTFPVGVMLDGVRNFGAIGIVGEVGWSHDDQDADDAFGDRLSTDLYHAAL